MRWKYLILCLMFVVAYRIPASAASGIDRSSAVNGFVDDPTAHAVYQSMIDVLHRSKTLYVESLLRWESGDYHNEPCRYKMWLKKPNFARVEVTDKVNHTGILVGDGTDFWSYWTDGLRPRFQFDDDKSYKETGRNVFMKELSPARMHSIAHKTGVLGTDMMTILEPSMFHNCPSSIESTMDGVGSLGTEKIGRDLCDVIEVSYMKHQRSRYYWISRRDHLPRKLKEIVRVNTDITILEDWSNISVDKPISDGLFQWSPPAGWKEWRIPTPEEQAKLKPGMMAPDFDLTSINGGRIKLSDLRGKVVWLVVWRSG